MGKDSNIQWTDATWNVARGCEKVSEECKYCYMMRDSLGDTRYQSTQVVKTKGVFTFPLKYKLKESNCRPGRPLIFTSSLTDVFHVDIDPFRHEIWDIIRKCPHLIFQILTKRPERITECLPPDWGTGWENVWLGTSVGLQKNLTKLRDLLTVPAKIRFISMEPLLGPVDLGDWYFKSADGSYPFRGLLSSERTRLIHLVDWVIIGGESGNNSGKWLYRPCELEWIESIVDQCKAAKVPVFVKQMGTHLAKKLNLSDRHGGDITEFPKHLQIRQFPNT